MRGVWWGRGQDPELVQSPEGGEHEEEGGRRHAAGQVALGRTAQLRGLVLVSSRRARLHKAEPLQAAAQCDGRPQGPHWAGSEGVLCVSPLPRRPLSGQGGLPERSVDSVRTGTYLPRASQPLRCCGSQASGNYACCVDASPPPRCRPPGALLRPLAPRPGCCTQCGPRDGPWNVRTAATAPRRCCEVAAGSVNVPAACRQVGLG